MDELQKKELAIRLNLLIASAWAYQQKLISSGELDKVKEEVEEFIDVLLV
jgi:hypothetical protein